MAKERGITECAPTEMTTAPSLAPFSLNHQDETEFSTEFLTQAPSLYPNYQAGMDQVTQQMQKRLVIFLVGMTALFVLFVIFRIL